MAEIVSDCPRCGAIHVTFDLASNIYVGTFNNWEKMYEAFCICRHCSKSTVLILKDKNIQTAFITKSKNLFQMDSNVNNLVRVAGYVSDKDKAPLPPPDYLPDEIKIVFQEGASCLAINCYNAAATMFRLCVDISTRNLLPGDETEGLNKKIRRDLGLRIPWLIANRYLPDALHELSTCIKEDGNDGAHAGNLRPEDAQDLLEFTYALLERLYTEPEKLRLAKERREARRKKDA